MKTPSMGAIGFGAVGLAAILLLAIGAPNSRKVETAAPTAAAPPPSVAAGGFTLASTTVDLPVDDQQFPDGAGAAIVNANCTSCHSASMALTQPKLTADQWKATVTKMREVYHAPIADADVPVILAYLNGLSAKQ